MSQLPDTSDAYIQESSRLVSKRLNLFSTAVGNIIIHFCLLKQGNVVSI